MNTVRTLSKRLENVKKFQTEVTELKSMVTELENTLVGFNRRLGETELKRQDRRTHQIKVVKK